MMETGEEIGFRTVPPEKRADKSGLGRGIMEGRMDREQTVLSENWKFHLEEPGECVPGTGEGYPRTAASGAWYKGFDDSGWRSVRVPHDWSVEQPFSKRYSSGTGYLAGGTGWYRVRFGLPEAYRGKSVKVVFDGIYKNSQVWCNSYYLGRRPYGYSTFSYDITHAAVFGEEENVLCVKVVHTDLADSRWFTGSGITRKVTVVAEEPVHPAEYGVFFSAEQVEADEKDAGRGRARIVIRHWTEDCRHGTGNGTADKAGNADRQGCPAESAMVRIRTALLEEDGRAALTLEGQTAAGGECVLTGTLEQAGLWSPEHPYLYTMRTWYALADGEDTEPCPEYYLVDETPVGIRGIVFDAQKGFFLNGAETKLKGVCVHHDGGVLGAAMEPEIWQRRLEALKECGCNAIRCSHNPHMPELYELCDRMGFLVMDEAFDEWENAKNKWSTGHNVYPPVHEGYFEEFPQWHKADLQAMVRRDRNHPSVILWSIGNEIDYPNDPYCHPSFDSMTGNNDANKPAAERQYDVNKPNAVRLVTIAAGLEREVRQEDATRPVTLAAAFPELSAETGLFEGLDVVGYNYKEHLYEADHGRFPGKPLLGSENGHSYGAWLAVRDNAFISGQFLWTGIDYLGEARGWPVHGSPAGILTCAGDRKPEFYRRKSFWRGEPAIAIATRRISDGDEDWLPMESHWNYEEGEEILVKVYSNLPRVRLVLEGWKTDGEKGVRPDGQDTPEFRRREGTEARERQDFGILDEYNGDGAYCYRVSYRPGTLVAEGYGAPAAARALGTEGNSQAPAAVCSLAAVGQAAGLECRIWRQPDALTGQSWEEASSEPGYLYQLEINLQDEQGRTVSWQERTLAVEVDGAGVLAGLENGNLADVTPYRESSRATFRGRLLAYVRRTASGEIAVRISMVDGRMDYCKTCRLPYPQKKN
nr:glycoside hydrolase family 2 TIM barrel-domain containing protein [uncultured Acetatifactor sp.]